MNEMIFWIKIKVLPPNNSTYNKDTLQIGKQTPAPVQ